MTKLFLTILFLAPLFSFMGSKQVSKDPNLSKQTGMFNFGKSTPRELIELLKNTDNKRSKLNQIVFNDKAPADWIKKSDIGFLMTLIHSSDTAKCFVSVLSSQACFNNCFSTLGGQAIEMIECYREKVRFPRSFFNCPKTDAKKVKEIHEWRNANSH